MGHSYIMIVINQAHENSLRDLQDRHLAKTLHGRKKI